MSYTDVSALLRQLLGFLLDCTLFLHVLACTLIAGAFALARALTRRKRERGGGALT